MVLTLEQKRAVNRGEPVTIRFPDMEEDCVLIRKAEYLEITQLEADMDKVRQRIKHVFTPDKVRNLVKLHPPDATWFQEDHSKLYEGGS